MMMSQYFGIAAVQMQVVPWNPAATWDRMAQLVESIKSKFPWIDMICFPELCLTGLDSFSPLPAGADRYETAQAIPGPMTQHLSELARRQGVWLQPGSMYELENGLMYNTAVVFSPEGELVARYRKMFPWRPWEVTQAGSEFCVFDIPGIGRFGLAICYDGWFPEFIRTLVWMGAEVILHPALTATADRDAEVTIEQAMALLNQCYMIDVNAVGGMGGGRSLMVDPNGRVLQQAGPHEEVLTQILDLDLVRHTREYGTLGLNQLLKQLRDFPGGFPPYQEGLAQGDGMRHLGPLQLYENIRKA
jgi:predicted amidohydrolase